MTTTVLEIVSHFELEYDFKSMWKNGFKTVIPNTYWTRVIATKDGEVIAYMHITHVCRVLFYIYQIEVGNVFTSMQNYISQIIIGGNVITREKDRKILEFVEMH